VSDAERWQAVLRSQAAAEPWVYAVRTTGVYCRPTCQARRPRPENVRFFDTAGLARAAGFRACRRCRPDGPDPLPAELAAVVAACRAVVAAGGPVDAARLERVTGLGTRQLATRFERVVGASPRAFGDAVRTGTARALLRERGQVSQALFASGFGSVRAFYETAAATLGMTPSAYATGAAGAAAVGQHRVEGGPGAGGGQCPGVVRGADRP